MAEEKQMEVVKRNGNESIEIKCVCKKAVITVQDRKCTGPDLYYCLGCEKSSDPEIASNKYCKKCGPGLHAMCYDDHEFDKVVSIKAILKTDADEDKASWGKKLLVAMIGNARFNQISPYVEKVPAILTVGVTSIALISQVATHSGKVLFAAKNIGSIGTVTTVVATVLEMTVYGYRWYKGDISGKEWLTLNGKAIIRNGAALAGMAAGAKLGAGFGSALAPGVGTGIGIVLGALIGFLCGKGAEALYDELFPNGEEQAKKDAVKDALKYFHYQEKDIKNKKIFNKKELNRRFRQYALDAHPDRRDGDDKEWQVLSAHYGILQGLCEENKSNKEIVQKAIKY